MRYLFRWQCQDSRYSIREKGTTSTFRYKQPRCRWDKTYDNLPTDYECVLTHCDNATNTPSTTHNYNFTWDEDIIPIGGIVEYRCKDGMALENNTEYKHNASTSSYIHCLEDGLLHYPNPWTMCSETIECIHPTNLTVPDDMYTSNTKDVVYYQNTIRLVYRIRE